MSDDQPIDVEEWAATMPLADTAVVVMSVTVLEDWVTAAIKTKMRRLSNTLTERLFRGYGPLSTFSARIDIAYALELIDEQTFNDLKALKDIRNEFAHTSGILHFKSKELRPLFQRLTGWTGDIHPHQLFRERVFACVEALKPPIKTRALVEAILAVRKQAEPNTSPDKSA